ncbi:hypothetical protein C2S53_004195 [Perilla frutescens var. hirtella]|uniref:Uncharacterized protein n=1 Tax=Perilla frutescens var. hirtella TaxID=608512 RepID=A0AAD4PCT6_PERFH|nr:hypothetical protein C2S53_004195 [Perilla frutescens var. hirtella]
MEVEKRKRVDDGKTNGKNGKPREDDGGLKRVAPPLPPDEEVEEFFAIVKRIRVALKYFQRRDGVRCDDGGEPAAKPTWSPSFRREDFDGVKTDPDVDRKTGLDLNSDPVSDGSDSV